MTGDMLTTTKPCEDSQDLAPDSSQFLHGKPWRVSEADVQARWSFQKPGSGTAFRCAWCGHKFKAGDIARCIYTNTAPEHKTVRGNPFVCANCDGPDAIDRLVAMAERVQQVKRECW